MITLGEVKDNIGRTARLTINNFNWAVTIIDVTIAFGNVRYLVSPVAGDGRNWVNADKVVIDQNTVTEQ